MSASTNFFQNRIVGYGTKPADQFEANPLNYRIHPQRQRDAVRASLRELGWIGVVVENKRTGRLIDGHERVWQALENNEPVPYIEVDLSEEEERLALAVFDPITYMAETDAQVLDELLREVDTGEAVLQELLAELAEDAGLYVDEAQPIADVAPQMDKAEELRQKWQVEAGQLWQLDQHRLICGDCTDPDVVARVMNGERAVCMWTDPPYGVDYVGKTKDALTIENDGADDLPQLLSGFLSAANDALEPGSPYYIAHPAGELCLTFGNAIVAAGWKLHETLVWVKDTMVLGHSDYHYMHEPIYYGWLPGNGRSGRGNHEGSRWYGDNAQVSVFHVDRPKRSEEHPTMKPVELIVMMLRNSTRRGDLVYEPFSGSGSTLMACEALGRRCRAIELSPKFVAVAIDRWAAATGKTPVLLGGAND